MRFSLCGHIKKRKRERGENICPSPEAQLYGIQFRLYCYCSSGIYSLPDQGELIFAEQMYRQVHEWTADYHHHYYWLDAS